MLFDEIISTMKCFRIINYLYIQLCFLNEFVTSTNDTGGLGGLTFEDHDEYWPMNPQHSPTHSNEDYSELFNTHSSDVSSEKSEPEGTFNIDPPPILNDTEKLFFERNKPGNLLPWKEVENNNTALLQKICFAAWPEHISDKKCESMARPYGDTSGFSIQLYGKYKEVIRAHILRCKCYTNGTKRDYVRSKIEPLYLAKHDDSSLFLFKLHDNIKFRKLMMIGMIPLNLTDIISSTSSIEPPNPKRTSSPITWNLTQIEKEFYMMYHSFSDAVKWQAIRDNDNQVLQRICIAAWEGSIYKRCRAKSVPCRDPKSNGMKAKLADNYDAVTVRADFLKCRCSSDSKMKILEIITAIKPIYFAKYNNKTVFRLISLGDKGSHNLKVMGLKTLNNIII